MRGVSHDVESKLASQQEEEGSPTSPLILLTCPYPSTTMCMPPQANLWQGMPQASCLLFAVRPVIIIIKIITIINSCRWSGRWFLVALSCDCIERIRSTYVMMLSLPAMVGVIFGG